MNYIFHYVYLELVALQTLNIGTIEAHLKVTMGKF